MLHFFRYLATGTNFTALHFEFLMGVSTISRIVSETCDILWRILQPIEMTVPTTQDWLEISDGYFKTSQFPHCVGAVDGKHIRVECPKNSGTLYYNYKQYYSLILLAICDSNYCFRVIDVGSYLARRAIATFLKNRLLGKNFIRTKLVFLHIAIYQVMISVNLNHL